MDERKKRAVVGWRRQGIPIRSQLLTVIAAFNRPGCVLLYFAVRFTKDKRRDWKEDRSLLCWQELIRRS